MASRDKDKPNILFILTDDQGPWAMGCAGNKELRTPNLDRLAASGTRFDSFFCTSPVCSPARASIFTGRIPSQHGVHDWLVGSNDSSRARTEEERFLAGQPTYPEALAKAGYDNCISGKLHLGYGLEPQFGFQSWYAMPGGGCAYYNPPIAEDKKLVYHKGEYASDLFTDNGIKFLEGQLEDERPFCLHVHYNAPHAPWGREQHPSELWDDYHDNCPFESVPGDSEPRPRDFILYNEPGPKRRRADLAGYFTAITAMDRNVGRLLDWLEEKGLRENTLVVFMSDNGMNMGHHGIYGKGNGTRPQNMFEESVKVPCLISRPGSVPQGVVSEELLSQYDWQPTLMDYLGLGGEIPEGLPGSSFAPLLRGEEMAERQNVVVFDEYGPVRMIRSREWKLVWRYPSGPHELYHLSEDPQERTNLMHYRGNAKVIEKMRRELEEWFARYTVRRFDGSKLPVTGKGQLARADLEDAFNFRVNDKWLRPPPK